MSVGLLLITHGNTGNALLQNAVNVLGFCPLRARALAVEDNSNRDRLQREAERLLATLDDGDGVLILTDLYGSTPSNIATALQQPGKVNVLAGVNLSMVVKVLNYAEQDLAHVTEKALNGARASIIECPPTENPGMDA